MAKTVETQKKKYEEARMKKKEDKMKVLKDSRSKINDKTQTKSKKSTIQDPEATVRKAVVPKTRPKPSASSAKDDTGSRTSFRPSKRLRSTSRGDDAGAAPLTCLNGLMKLCGEWVS